VASFTPLSRPEFIAFVPLIAIWLGDPAEVEIAALPAHGHGFYSLIAWIAAWVIPLLVLEQRPPNPGQSPYGYGRPMAFRGRG
jgi:hypothetical protein